MKRQTCGDGPFERIDTKRYKNFYRDCITYDDDEGRPLFDGLMFHMVSHAILNRFKYSIGMNEKKSKKDYFLRTFPFVRSS